jgi:hypothetical protein
MGASLVEVHRVLKPNATATVVFQATDNSVWSALEEACEAAGFVVDDASVLTKGQPSFKQIKGKGEGERVAATDVVLTLRPRRRGRGRVVRHAPFLSVLHREIAGGQAAATSGHLFGVAAAAAVRSGRTPLAFDDLLAILRENFHETNGVWTLRENDELAA